MTKKLGVIALLTTVMAMMLGAYWGSHNTAKAGNGHGHGNGHHKVLVCINGEEKYLPPSVVRHNPNATLGHCPPPVEVPPVDTGGGDVTPPIVVDNPPVVGVGGSVYVCDASNVGPQVSRVVDVTTLPSEYESGARLANEILGGAQDVGIQLNENGSGVFRCDVPAGAVDIPGVVGDGAGVLFDAVLYADVIALHNSTIGYRVLQQS